MSNDLSRAASGGGTEPLAAVKAELPDWIERTLKAGEYVRRDHDVHPDTWSAWIKELRRREWALTFNGNDLFYAPGFR